MPNTNPPITDAATLALSLNAAATKARCDYAQYLGAGPDNVDTAAALAGQVAGLKMYLDQTYGPLRLDDMTLWAEHFARWPKDNLPQAGPIVAHAESRTMAAVILMATLFDRSVHIAHVSLREEILLIRRAKEAGVKVTCEVGPHHLFLSQDDVSRSDHAVGFGRSEVRPRLATRVDQQALWDNLDVIDCFATDHAPHTAAEKDGENPPPGFPGLETALPLLLTAVREGRLSVEDLVGRMHENPKRIFGLPEQQDTWIEVDEDAAYEIRAAESQTRCGWTPFEGRRVYGRVRRVFLRGAEAYRDGRVLARPGTGRNLRSERAFVDWSPIRGQQVSS